MRIVFFIGSLKQGGAERVIANLSNFFIQKHNVTIITTTLSDEICYELDNNISIQTLDVKKNKRICFIKKNLMRLKRLEKLLKEVQPNIIVSFLPEQNFRVLFLRKKIRVPILISERNDPQRTYVSKSYQFLMKKLYIKADGYIFQTKKARDYFNWIEGIDQKSWIISNPVNQKFIGKLYTGSRAKTIVTVGRLEKQKNHSLLIKAFKAIKKIHPDYQLIIFGEGSQRESLEKLIDDLNLKDDVFLPGNKKNIREMIINASLFILSSDFEGMPNALMEALVLGIPSIATDCPCGGPEMLIKDGENGILFPVGDEKELVKKILDVIENKELSKKLSYNAWNSMKAFYPEIILGEWEKCLKHFVN